MTSTHTSESHASDDATVALLRRTLTEAAATTEVILPSWPLRDRRPDDRLAQVPERRPGATRWLAAAAALVLVAGAIVAWQRRGDTVRDVVVAAPAAESPFRPWLDPSWLPFEAVQASSFQSAAPPQFRADVRDADGRWATLRWTSYAGSPLAGSGQRPPDMEDTPVGAKGRTGDVDFYAWATPTPPDPALLAANVVPLPAAPTDLLVALVSDLTTRCTTTDCAGYDPESSVDPALEGVVLVRRGPDDMALQTVRNWTDDDGSWLSVIAYPDADTLPVDTAVKPVPGLDPVHFDDPETQSEALEIDGHRARFMSDSQRATLIVERPDIGSTVVISGTTGEPGDVSDRIAVNSVRLDADGVEHPIFAFGRPTLERIARSLDLRPGADFEAAMRDEAGAVLDGGVAVARDPRGGWSAVAGDASFPGAVCAVRVVVTPLAPGTFVTGNDPCGRDAAGDLYQANFEMRTAPDGTLVAVAMGGPSAATLRFEFADGAVDEVPTVAVGDHGARVAVAGVRRADVTLRLLDAEGRPILGEYHFTVGGGA